MSKLREEDTVVVWKMDRIARSLPHLIKLIEHFEKENIQFKSIQEQFIDTINNLSINFKCCKTLLPASSNLQTLAAL